MKMRTLQRRKTTNNYNNHPAIFTKTKKKEEPFFKPPMKAVDPENQKETGNKKQENTSQEKNNSVNIESIAKKIYDELDSWFSSKDNIIEHLKKLNGDTSKLNSLNAIYQQLYSISLQAHIRSEFSGDELNDILVNMDIPVNKQKSYIGGKMEITSKSRYKKASNFKELIILIKAAEDKLIANGFIDVFDRIKILRGIYYGTSWSMDFLKEKSEERNSGFDVYTASTTRPKNPTAILGKSLFNALKNSPEVRNGKRSIDFGHLIIGLEARSKYASREVNLPLQGGAGLETSTWLGDIGGGAGMLAMRRVNNPNIRAKTLVFNASGHDYGAKVNLEGDIAAYIAAYDKSETDGPSFPDIKKYGFVSEAIANYLLPQEDKSLSNEWNDRVRLFTQMIGGKIEKGKLTNKKELIRKITQKITDFSGMYAFIRYLSSNKHEEKVYRETSKYVEGASHEVAIIFVDILENIIKGNTSELVAVSNPNPSPKGSEVGILKNTADTIKQGSKINKEVEKLKNKF